MDHPLNAQARFAAASVAVLGTIADDGRPRLVPVTFVLVGDRVLTAIDHKPKSTRRLARLEDIDRDPSVSLLVQHYSDDWTALWWVRADGTARVDADGDAIAEAARTLAEKYEQYRDLPPQGPVIDVAVDSWSSWEAASG